jgi:hypothetical protein
MLADQIAGDPMSNQKWVRSSLRNLSKKLKEQGHEACTHTVARMLRTMGYSLQVNIKARLGTQHPNRDDQFRHIAEMKTRFLNEGLPVVSIDTKRKNLSETTNAKEKLGLKNQSKSNLTSLAVLNV